MPDTSRPAAPAGFDLIGEASFTRPRGSLRRRPRRVARVLLRADRAVDRVAARGRRALDHRLRDVLQRRQLRPRRRAPRRTATGSHRSCSCRAWSRSTRPTTPSRRKVAQRGFTRGHMRGAEAGDRRAGAPAHRRLRGRRRLRPDERLRAGAHDADDLRAARPPGADEAWFRGIRFDSFRVLAAAQEPIPEDEVAEVWDRYAAAHERLREIVEERRDGDGTDVISEMARARDADGAAGAQHRVDRAARDGARRGRHGHDRAAHLQRRHVPLRAPRSARRGDRRARRCGSASSRRRCAGARPRRSCHAAPPATSRSRA